MYLATTQQLVEGVVSGYNATVFAYGPSGRAVSWEGGRSVAVGLLTVSQSASFLRAGRMLAPLHLALWSLQQPRKAGRMSPLSLMRKLSLRQVGICLRSHSR